MKKSLLALSLAAALSGSAFAADVQVYGLIDLSLSYVHSDSDGWGSDSKFTMENAREFGSRFGIKGSEDLGNGYKVGFVLENGFKADTGDFDQGGKMFGRESHLDLYTPYGKIAFGSMPVYGSVLGADGLFRAIDPLFANYTEAFGSGFVTASSWTRVDNAISYVSPTFAGFTGYAMYSFKNSVSGAGTEGTSESDRYASLAVRYLGGPLEVVMVADTTIYGSGRSGNQNSDDGWTATLGGNYTFSNGLKLIAFGQYFKNMDLNAKQRAGVVLSGLENGMAALNAARENAGLEEFEADYGFVDGYGLSIGANYPLFGGVIKGQLAYRDMDNQNDIDFTRYMASVGYDYQLSKRTAVYVMGGYTQEKMEYKGENITPNGYEFTFGTVHRF